MKKYILYFIVLAAINYKALSQALPYKNSKLPIEERVKDLLSRMTPQEKFWQLFMIPGEVNDADSAKYVNGIFGFQVSARSGNGDASDQMLKYNATENASILAKKINRIQKYFIEKSRLGIPIIAFDEALHGLERDGATAFPQSIALAATWDTSLMKQVAQAIAEETKLRGIRQVLSPVINIASDVRWGRTEETYGEDPFLTSQMGVAFVSAFEKNGIITTPKHFVANVGDGGRDSYPIHFDERLLDEIYFPPFKACIEKGGARSIMTAYNSVDGSPATANSWLLQKILKGDWNFSGFVISDAAAVGGSNVLHNTSPNNAVSAQQAITNGLDVIFQTAYEHHKLFDPPFFDGSIDQKRIDDAVSRVLRAKFELGLFENPYVPEENVSKINMKAHKELAKKAALESIILLKNASLPGQKNKILPLNKNIKSIAVIGEDATEARLGGYSGPGNNKINILDGIKESIGKARKMLYAEGTGIKNEDWVVIPPEYLFHNENNKKEKGFKGEYYNNILLNDSPFVTRTDMQIDFHSTFNSPARGMKNDFYSIRWQGVLISPATGNFKIGLDGDDGYRLYVNEKLIIDNWKKQTYTTSLVDYSFQKNKEYNIRIEFYEPAGNGKLKFIWNVNANNNWQQKINAAVAAARKCDVAIVVAGIHEGEFQDRASLALPGHQEEMIQQIAAIGKPVVVILVGGSAITMNSWLDKIPAVLDVWYPGEEGGRAVADVLFGHNPSGKLPVTFPISEAQLPLVYNHKPTGRGDDYYNLSGLPLYSFGYGLSYTTFDYSNLKFNKNNISKTDSSQVNFTLKNTGAVEGDEVVQLYIRDVIASVARPVLELKGFQRIHLKPGETKDVSFMITPEMLTMLDE
ncbi:MAG: glycoside hydrolase family 3 N-terminal domain-containing protein, partial [Ginsengibacter sp.]